MLFQHQHQQYQWIKISNAVPESNPFANTTFEILSGFSSTSLYDKLEPIVETIPSPTRAKIVDSFAPPTSLSRFALTEF